MLALEGSSRSLRLGVQWGLIYLGDQQPGIHREVPNLCLQCPLVCVLGPRGPSPEQVRGAVGAAW